MIIAIKAIDVRKTVAIDDGKKLVEKAAKNIRTQIVNGFH